MSPPKKTLTFQGSLLGLLKGDRTSDFFPSSLNPCTEGPAAGRRSSPPTRPSRSAAAAWSAPLNARPRRLELCEKTNSRRAASKWPSRFEQPLEQPGYWGSNWKLQSGVPAESLKWKLTWVTNDPCKAAPSSLNLRPSHVKDLLMINPPNIWKPIFQIAVKDIKYQKILNIKLNIR